MAKMQVYLLAAVLLASSAVEVLGRAGHVLPHDIVRKPVKLPDEVKAGVSKRGDFAKSTDNIHGSQIGRGSGNAKVEHGANGKKTAHGAETDGFGTIKKLETRGNGHGEARLNVDAGGFTKIGNVKSGGVVKGTSKAEDDGKAEVELVDAYGTADDKKFIDETSGTVKIKDNGADGKDHGEARNTAGAFAGGSVKGKTVSGIKATAVDKATNDADSDTDADGHTFGEDRKFGKDVSYATGDTDTDSDATSRHSDANGKGELHGGSKAGKTFATVEVKGTSASKNLNTNKRSEAEGEGDATAHSTDFPGGKAQSYAESDSLAEGKIKGGDSKGGAKGTGKAIGNSGVKHETEAFSKTETSFNTGVTNHGPKDTNAKASSKHVGSLKGRTGSVHAGGESNVHVSHGAATAKSDGSAFADKTSG